MYFPVGWPKYLRIPQKDRATLTWVSSNRDRTLFAVLTTNSIGIWFCKPSVQIVCFQRSDNSVNQFGCNQLAEWKPDSTMIAVTTSKGYIIFYKLELDMAVGNNHQLFVQKHGKTNNTRKDHRMEPVSGDGIPSLKLIQFAYIQIPGAVKSLVCIREDLMVATGFGQLQRIRWDGFVNGEKAISLGTIKFSMDMQHSRASQLDQADVYFRSIEHSPLLAGFAVVLSTGQAAFIVPNSHKSEQNQTQGVWAQGVKHATCVAVNHKYRLIAYGCENGECVVCSVDELTGALHVSHKMAISSKDFPDVAQVAGGVRMLRWSPDGCALVIVWEKAGLSLWSVFGALLVCTLGGEYQLTQDSGHNLLGFKSLEWGCEGYQLWCVSHSAENPDGELLQLQFVKSALSVNPCMTNHEHLFLQGEDRLYLNVGDGHTKPTSPTESCTNGITHSHDASEADPSGSYGTSVLIGNKQWQIVSLPQNYLVYNWPIRHAAVDKSGHCVAVAGRTGFAHYALYSRKWKLFGNETQERDLVVSGGLMWWRDFICLACFNLLDQRDEIRFYPRTSKLDNTFAHTTKVPSQIMLLNLFRDILIVMCADCHIMLFHIERKNTQPNPSVDVTKLQEVAIGNFVPHPLSVVTVMLTSLRTETVGGPSSMTAANRSDHQGREAESILLNVAGKLLMFQRDRSSPQSRQKETKHKYVPFCAPIMVASNVENMWCTLRLSKDKAHLTEALWLGCGGAGMKVWLPLHQNEESKAHGFMSKRIMLPFQVDIYPLAVLFEAAVILGAANYTVGFTSSNLEGKANCESLPYATLERTSQLYLHHILRQLLRRNLGFHALEIARCCTDLPYFPHVLELLVHEVLEEEATSKEPIPDPLLPRVVAFVQEFPEYLQTIVHCARKTEVALWPYLFSTAGNPKDLFESCLLSGQLNTAASYLIILQNLEKPIVSKQGLTASIFQHADLLDGDISAFYEDESRGDEQCFSLLWKHATLLLDAALDQSQWELARDLVRFLKAIDPSEVDMSASPSPRSRHNSASIYPAGYPASPPISPHTSNDFMFRDPHILNMGVPMAETTSPKDSSKGSRERVRSKTEPQVIKNKKSPHPKEDSATAEQFFIDMIMCRHARKLLSSYKLRDLGCFAANVQDYQLVAWLKRERVRAARVEDFVMALKELHEEFNWPYPILTYKTFHHLHKNTTGAHPERPLRVTTLLDGWVGLTDPVEGEATDEGYNSHASQQQPGTPDLLPSQQSSSADIFLKPQFCRDDGSHGTTEQSDNSSQPGDVEYSVEQGGWSDTLCLAELEQMSQELANCKGLPQSELELRYLLQIMLEAGCLEWSLLIAIVLRDAMAVVRTVNTASMTDTPIEIVGRMREGISFLELWAETECFGYKPFLHAIRGQTQILHKIIQQNPANTRLSTARLSSSSLDSTQSGLEERSSVHSEDILEELEAVDKVEKEPPEEESRYECAVS